jgi:hypothetical protein
MIRTELLKFNPTPLQYIARFCIIASIIFTLIGLGLLIQTIALWQGLQTSRVWFLFILLFILIFLLFSIGKWLIPWRINRYYKGRLVLTNNQILLIDKHDQTEEVISINWYKLSIKQLVYLDVFTQSGKRTRFNLKLGTGYTTKMSSAFLMHECASRHIEFTVKSYLDATLLKRKRVD